jgi:hypothetical protein
VDAAEIDGAKVFEEWLDTEKAHCCRGAVKALDTRDAVLPILHAHAPPDVRRSRGMLELCR